MRYMHAPLVAFQMLNSLFPLPTSNCAMSLRRRRPAVLHPHPRHLLRLDRENLHGNSLLSPSSVRCCMFLYTSGRHIIYLLLIQRSRLPPLATIHFTVSRRCLVLGCLHPIQLQRRASFMLLFLWYYLLFVGVSCSCAPPVTCGYQR